MPKRWILCWQSVLQRWKHLPVGRQHFHRLCSSKGVRLHLLKSNSKPDSKPGAKSNAKPGSKPSALQWYMHRR